MHLCVYSVHTLREYCLQCFILLFQLQGHLECVTKMNSSVSQTVSVSLQTGNVMGILTVWMVQMSITDVLLGPALHLFSAVIMETASIVLGSVMVTMTAGIWAMRKTVPRSPSGALVGSGNVQATAFVWTWAKYVTILQIALMEQMNHLFAVSIHSACIQVFKVCVVVAAWMLNMVQGNLGQCPWSATKHKLAFHCFGLPYFILLL